MKHKSAHIAIGFVCLIMAFAITWQIRSVKYYKSVVNPDSIRAEELQQQLRESQEKNESLYKQVLQYKDEIDVLKENTDSSELLADMLKRAELIAGLTKVEGPGIIITLRDSTLPNTLNLDPNLYIVHDNDILRVINELCDAGAEAIQLNGERLISTSEIRCAGSTVSVNNNRYAAPYEIIAIGDSTNMENAIMMRDGAYDTLRSYGIAITVTKSSKVTVNAYMGQTNFKYASPVEVEEKGVNE